MKRYLLTFLLVIMTTVSFAINIMPPQANAAQVTGSTTITNTIVGVGAFVSNVSGIYNTGVGVDVLAANLTGSYNTAFGNMALKVNTSGYQNTSIGNSTLMANTTGYLNTAIGNGTLYTNTIGHHNSSLGDEAMFSNTTGSENSSFGYASLYNNVTTTGNSAFGNSSLGFHTTGDYNTAYGYYSGLFLSDGASPNLSSTYGLYLGYNSKALVSGGSNEIVIGASTVGHGTNSTTVGNNLTEKTYLAGTVYGSGTELLHINGDNIASTAFTLMLDQNSVGMATDSVAAYIATETANRIASDNLKANTNGDNIASTAFALALDNNVLGLSSTTVLSYIATESVNRDLAIATETANRIASDSLKANTSGDNIASTSFLLALDSSKLLNLTNGETNYSMSNNIGNIWSTATDTTSVNVNDMTYCGNGIVLAGTSNGGIIYRTTDYGLTWTIASDTPLTSVDAIEYCGDGLVFAAGDSTANVYKSTDYGLTWTTGASVVVAGVTSIEYCGNGIVLTANTSGQIYRSYNWGSSFDQASGTPSELFDLEYCGNGVVLVSGNDSVNLNSNIYKSIDYGATWSSFSSISNNLNTLISMKYCGGNVIIGGRINQTIVKSVDGGLTFRTLFSTAPFSARNIAYCGNGVLLTGAGIIYISTDYGDTWGTPTNGPGDDFYSILYTDNGVVLAGADAGLILRSQSVYNVADTHAKTDGSNIASTAFTLQLDQSYFGASSTVSVAEMNDAIATEALYRTEADATLTSDISTHIGIIVPIASGGTGAINVEGARANLGVISSSELATMAVIVDFESRANYLGDTLTLSTATNTAYIPIASSSTFVAIPTDTIGIVYGTVLIKHLASDSARIVTFECEFENFDNTFSFIGSSRYVQTEVNETAGLLQASPTAILNGFRILGTGDNGTSFKVIDLCVKYL